MSSYRDHRGAGSTGLKTALAAAVLTSFAATAAAQDFPPFPEPAVGPFPDTRNMELRAQLVPAQIGAVNPRSGILLNDIWGWTSPNGEEYALVGTGDGMSIVRVTDPDNPVFIGIMPTSAPDDFANLWGDVGVFNVGRSEDDDDDDHEDDDDEHEDDDEDVTEFDDDDFTGYAYFTTEAGGVGINILELNQLDFFGPAPDSNFQIPPTAVFRGGGYESAHNIYVNQKSGFAYVAGAHVGGAETACDNEPFHPARFNTLILDLNDDPLNPTIVACRADAGEHDFYVVNYNGPDRDYRGREIAFVFDGRDRDVASRGGQRQDDTPGELVGGTTEIWDVTDKSDIRVVASFSVPGMCFSHAGWTSSSRHEFLLINDELDELRDAEGADGFFRNNFCSTDTPPNTLSGPGVFVLNIRDLDNPLLQERFEIDSPGDNDHNFVRRGNKLFWAVYTAGTSVLKMKKKHGRLQLSEIGRLDSEPRIVPAFNGQWGIFPFPSSDTIVASDIVNGLMIMTLSDDDDADDDLRVAATGGTASFAASATLSASAAAPGSRSARGADAARKIQLLDRLHSAR